MLTEERQRIRNALPVPSGGDNQPDPAVVTTVKGGEGKQQLPGGAGERHVVPGRGNPVQKKCEPLFRRPVGIGRSLPFRKAAVPPMGNPERTQFPVGAFAVAKGAGNRVGIRQSGGKCSHPSGEPDIVLIGQKNQVAGRHGNRLFEVPIGAERNRVADITNFRMCGKLRRNRLTGRLVRGVV